MIVEFVFLDVDLMVWSDSLESDTLERLAEETGMCLHMQCVQTQGQQILQMSNGREREIYFLFHKII